MKLDIYPTYLRYCKILIALLFFFTVTFQLAHANILYVNALDNTCSGQTPCYTDIQSAIDGASVGDTIFLQNGTYSPSGQSSIYINKSVSILGESEVNVIIEGGSLVGFGLYIQADDVVIKSLTVQNCPSYGIINEGGKGNGLIIEQVTSKNNGKSGIGIRDISNISFKNITLQNNAGNGLSITSVHNVVVENITTSGNQFSNIDGYTAAIGIFSSSDSTTSNVTVQGEFFVDEPVGIYIEPGPKSGNYHINPPLAITNITISDSLKAIVVVDIDVIPNAAQPDVDFDSISGADAIYYFKDLETATECAEVAARLNYNSKPSDSPTSATDGILEQYLFIYDIENDKVLYLPIIDESPDDFQYGCTGEVTFSAVVDPRSTKPLTGTWQVSTDDGSSWNNLVNDTTYSGVNSTTLTIESVIQELDGNIYRYISQNEYGADTSAGALLTVPEICFLCQNEPTLFCPDDITVVCNADNLQYIIDPENTGEATATSNCRDVKIATIYYVDNDMRSLPCNVGDITRTWYAKDDLGNIDSCTQTITVVDTVKPVLFVSGYLPLPEDTVFDECNPSLPAPPTVVAEDNCSTIDQVHYEADTVYSGCDGNYTIFRTWTATDKCDNTATYTQSLRVVCKPEIELCELDNWSEEPNALNHAIYLFHSPLDPDTDTGMDTEAQRFVWDTSDPDHQPQFLKLPGRDTAVVSGIVKSRLDENAKFEVMLILVKPESGNGYTGGFIADNSQALETAEKNLDDWTFWKMSEGSKLIGKGNIQGTLNLTPVPGDYSNTAQEGIGGNAKDSDLGLASWFLYEGDLIYNGKNVSLKSQGDINADIISCGTVCSLELPTVVNHLDGNLLVSDDLIQLSWGTFMEGLNIVVVEKSLDGVFFTTVDSLQGTQNNINLGSHEFFDEDVAGSDVWFYRLKVYRPDGSYVYTNVVAVYIGDPDKHFYEVYPNPADKFVYIRSINPVEGNHQYIIYDARGRRVRGSDLNVDFVFRVNVLELSPGYYFFQVIRPDGEALIKRLSIKR